MVSTTGTTIKEPPAQPERDSRRDESNDEPLVSRVSGEPSPHLELLDDENVLAILEALTEGPKRGRELIGVCEASRSTVYRRLNSLVETGFVAAEVVLDPDGHHCKQFRLVRDSVTVSVDPDALTVTLRRR